MTAIPDDIMKAAMEAYLSLMDDDLYDDHKYGSEHIARAIMAERERAAKVADSYKDHADNEFNERVRRSHRGGKNLELAASAGAGMSHAARKIAAAIRKGAKP